MAMKVTTVATDMNTKRPKDMVMDMVMDMHMVMNTKNTKDTHTVTITDTKSTKHMDTVSSLRVCPYLIKIKQLFRPRTLRIRT